MRGDINPRNIAEGAARNTHKDFANFLYIAQGSAAELETQLIISYELGLINQHQRDMLLDQLNHISRTVGGLQRSLQLKN